MKTEYPIMIGGANFGCGSSREHAPVAMGASGAIQSSAQTQSAACWYAAAWVPAASARLWTRRRTLSCPSSCRAMPL